MDHHPGRGLTLPFCVACLIAGCERRSLDEQTAAPTPPTTPATAPAVGDPQLDRSIEELIEQLAISDEPAANAPVYTPHRDTPRNDKRVIAYEAAAKLREHGKAAFPQLLANLNDERQSVAFRRIIPHTVGLACYCIIEDAVYNLPPDYQGSFFRTGADGKDHERPRFSGPGIFDWDTIDEWLKAREDKSLTELQIETLQWLIEQEKAIGFPTEEDRERYLFPLERQLNRLRTPSP